MPIEAKKQLIKLKAQVAALSADVAVLNNTASTAFHDTFTQADIGPDDAYEALHDLDKAAVSAVVFDNEGFEIKPTRVEAADTNTLLIYLTNYVPIVGTYSFVISG